MRNRVPIRGYVLQAKLYRLGISQTQASLELGRSRSYLSVCFERGWMPESMVYSIQERYGIPIEDFAKELPSEKVSENTTGFTQDLILEELRTIRSLLQEVVNQG